jgi:hypothetical protein
MEQAVQDRDPLPKPAPRIETNPPDTVADRKLAAFTTDVIWSSPAASAAPFAAKCYRTRPTSPDARASRRCIARPNRKPP